MLVFRHAAAMRLVIVESPNKTKKIREFLGAGYRVAASFGHVRDLPPTGGLSVAFRGGRVLPNYQPLERASRAINELRSLAKLADEVLLATDPDREGEAIAWHIAEILVPILGDKPCRRVTFNAITKAGSNKFHGSVSFNLQPNSLLSDEPNTFAADNDGEVCICYVSDEAGCWGDSSLVHQSSTANFYWRYWVTYSIASSI